MLSVSRSVSRTLTVLAGFALAGSLAGCNSSINLSQHYTTPGWYLEKPRRLLTGEANYVAGPFTYDDCEVERLKTKIPGQYLCNREIVIPSDVYNKWKAFTPARADSSPPPSS